MHSVRLIDNNYRRHFQLITERVCYDSFVGDMLSIEGLLLPVFINVLRKKEQLNVSFI